MVAIHRLSISRGECEWREDVQPLRISRRCGQAGARRAFQLWLLVVFGLSRQSAFIDVTIVVASSPQGLLQRVATSDLCNDLCRLLSWDPRSARAEDRVPRAHNRYSGLSGIAGDPRTHKSSIILAPGHQWQRLAGLAGCWALPAPPPATST